MKVTYISGKTEQGFNMDAKGQFVVCTIQKQEDKRESGLVLSQPLNLVVGTVKSLGIEAVEKLGNIVGKTALIASYKDHFEHNGCVIVRYMDILATL